MSRNLSLIISAVYAGLLACGPSQARSRQAPPDRTTPPVSRAPDADAAPAPAPGPPADVEPDPAPPKAPEVIELSLSEIGVDGRAMDRTRAPCDDFYAFACGGWIADAALPDGVRRHDRFSEARAYTEQVIKDILDSARAVPGPDPITARLGELYGACMDEDAIEKAGVTGIEPLLRAAGAIKKRADVTGAIAALHRHGIWAVFRADAERDFATGTTTTLFLDSTELGLGSPRAYTDSDKPAAADRRRYRDHIERMFRLAGRSRAQARRAGSDVVRIETELARVTKSPVQRRHWAGMHNPLDRAGLRALAPAIDWDAYFRALGAPELARVSATSPDYLARVSQLVRSIKPVQWRSYLQWQVLEQLADLLPRALVAERAGFLDGRGGIAPPATPRWSRCVRATERAMGDLLGRRYVAHVGLAEGKQVASAMVARLQRALGAALDRAAWMTPATRERARAKLDSLRLAVGYPDPWPDAWPPRDASAAPAGYAHIMLEARARAVARQLAAVGKPYVSDALHAAPHAVRVTYSPLAHQLTVSAGALQRPFFGAQRTTAANFGALGAMIGHELIHGFDSIGAQFDGTGRLAPWWQPADRDGYRKAAQCVIDHYDPLAQPAPDPDGASQQPGPGVRTLAENLADIGGVHLAFEAYRDARAGQTPRYRADGFTEDQVFFLAFAQSLCSKADAAESARRIAGDRYLPARIRVHGALHNTPAFAEAFQCAEATPMRPARVCRVW